MGTTPQLPAGVQVFERGWLSSNNIFLVGPEQTALVDSGYCTHAPQTLELVSGSLSGRTLDRLVNTHLHSDHCGGNAALQAAYPLLQTFIPPGQADRVAVWDPVALTYVPTGQQCPEFRFDQRLQAGTSIRLGSHDWEVHSARGHDPHSVILFEPETATLISADALWENGFGVVFPELEGIDAFDEVSETLDLIESLEPAMVIPGHGKVFPYTASVLGRARQRLDALANDPGKHARHAAKVLLKFKLLEAQQLPFEQLVSWAQDTSYFEMIRGRFSPEPDIRIWIKQLCEELILVGAAKTQGHLILNN